MGLEDSTHGDWVKGTAATRRSSTSADVREGLEDKINAALR